MKTRTLIGTALLLSLTGIGIACAAPDTHTLDLFGVAQDEHREAAAPTGALRLAESQSESKHNGAYNQRHREDDDDEDDDHGRGALPQTGPADPNAPVPNNGLFNGTTRPKVEVQ